MDNAKVMSLMGLMGELASERHTLIDPETVRNADNLDIYEKMIRAAFPDVDLVIAGHHIMYTRKGHALPFEIPSADYLIFDHFTAERIWGASFRQVLSMLAIEPVATRDKKLRELLHE